MLRETACVRGTKRQNTQMRAVLQATSCHVPTATVSKTQGVLWGRENAPFGLPGSVSERGRSSDGTQTAVFVLLLLLIINRVGYWFGKTSLKEATK